MFRLFYSRDELTFYNLDETNLPPTCRWWFKVCLEIIVNKIFMVLESWNQRSPLWRRCHINSTQCKKNQVNLIYSWVWTDNDFTRQGCRFFLKHHLIIFIQLFSRWHHFLTGFYQENLTFFIRYFAKNVMFWTKFFWEKTWCFERYFDKNSRCVQYDI